MTLRPPQAAVAAAAFKLYGRDAMGTIACSRVARVLSWVKAAVEYRPLPPTVVPGMLVTGHGIPPDTIVLSVSDRGRWPRRAARAVLVWLLRRLG